MSGAFTIYRGDDFRTNIFPIRSQVMHVLNFFFPINNYTHLTSCYRNVTNHNILCLPDFSTQ